MAVGCKLDPRLTPEFDRSHSMRGRSAFYRMTGTPTVIADNDTQTLDRQLLVRMSAGESLALSEAIDVYLNRTVYAARRVIGDETEAEDIAQEAFVRLWQRASEMAEKPNAALGAWLKRVAVNLAIDRLRATQRLTSDDGLAEAPVAAGQLTELTAADASGRVVEALDALPDRQRTAIALFHFEDLSQREVAERMDITENALEALLKRGRQRLKAHLADDWQELLRDLTENRHGE
jgi:RNA polymerase sigma-70 factor (ECF subfamily)